MIHIASLRRRRMGENYPLDENSIGSWSDGSRRDERERRGWCMQGRGPGQTRVQASRTHHKTRELISELPDEGAKRSR